MKMKREIDFKKIENIIEPGNKNSYHMNFKNIMKYYKKYKCAIINNRDNQKVANLNKQIFLDSQYTVDIFLQCRILNNIQKTYD